MLFCMKTYAFVLRVNLTSYLRASQQGFEVALHDILKYPSA